MISKKKMNLKSRGFLIEASTLKKLANKAKKTGIPQNEHVRRALKKYLR